jgi:hypothetical protein
MASSERLLVSTYFVITTIAIHWSAIQLLTERKDVSCLTIIKKLWQLTMPYGGRSRKRHSLQTGI